MNDYPRERGIQIQHDFEGASLAELATLDLEIYDRIPDFRDGCPLCGGSDCAVRHGLYRRRVVERGGVVIEAFPIPRFRCRRRGTRTPEAVTFSVLPADLVPRRLCSLPFMLWVLQLLLEAEHSMSQVLDAIADSFSVPSGGSKGGEDSVRPWIPEATAVRRMLRLFSRTYVRLATHAEIDGVPLGGFKGGKDGVDRHHPSRRRERARRVVRWLAPPRASPRVLTFHFRHFPNLLFAAPSTQL